ncbi:hypothetical protein LOK49_Contig45G00011 [Camellia lanceoleosa]|nr:hypothetical protein LOK49_Contig45G00011 [Camellia lanceoleosa]
MFLMMKSRFGMKIQLSQHLQLIACVTWCAYLLMGSL